MGDRLTSLRDLDNIPLEDLVKPLSARALPVRAFMAINGETLSEAEARRNERRLGRDSRTRKGSSDAERLPRPTTKDEDKARWRAAEGAKKKAAQDMPATADALRTMHRGRQRLCALGWKDAHYCPKDGTFFAVIVYGSTGIFEACYNGDRPDGRVNCRDYLTHPHGMLFKPLADLSDAERARMDECMGQEKAAHGRSIEGRD